MKKIELALFVLIVIVGFLVRIVSLNWDEGNIFHPDERAIVMSATQISYPETLKNFLSPESSFNTNFFAYGNLPIYVLKISGDIMSYLNPAYSQYSGIYLIGRALNAVFSTLTIIVVFIYSKKLFNTKISLFASFFYAVSVFPIQNAHFFTVDTLLTLLILLVLVSLHMYYTNRKLVNLVLVGIFFGLCLATKISALPVIATILVFILIVNSKHHNKISFIAHSIKALIILGIFTGFSFIISQPYALIDHKDFIDQVLIQSKMGSDPFIFPYTLQYVGKIKLVYEFQNILLWGLGVPLGIFSFAGFFLITKNLILNFSKNIKFLPIILFTSTFFILNAAYAVGWMRYLLPIYPYLVIFAAFFVIKIINNIYKYKGSKALEYSLVSLVLVSSVIWTLSFMKIYFSPQTKIEASDWINENIPPGKTLAIEHWDDQLPIYNTSNYNYEILSLYDEDTKFKWQTIERQLDNADYVILASNRLYAPLQKLTNCNTLPKYRCYPLTAKYYENLFSEKLGFEKIAEFSSYPTVPILNIEINDQSADESFTVYDHPKITIFKKN